MKVPFQSVAALFFLCLSTSASAQGIAALPSRIAGEANAGLYNPTTERWNMTGLTILGSTAVGTSLLYTFADTKMHSTSSDAFFGSTSETISTVGNYLPLALPVGFFAVGRFLEDGSDAKEYVDQTAKELFESLAFTFGTSMTLKYAVARDRPNGVGNHSFPSVQTSMAFAAATTLAYQSPWYVAVPALAAASAVGFSHVDLSSNFASDVLIGAGVGLFFSTAVHQFHQSNESVDETASTPLMPMLASDTYGLSWFTTF